MTKKSPKGEKMITYYEISKAWKNVNDDVRFSESTAVGGGVRITFPNETYFEISTSQVYSNQKVFSMNVNQTLKAINLTVEYLKKTKLVGKEIEKT
ncbi:MAG: hypothetical protein GX675_01215 [Erysipelotrichaceae bacterium]|nr:hypothetical protein [Erysipelotrichaceae bacterium]